MIRAFKGQYLLFEDDNKKRKDTIVVIEILGKKSDSIQVIVCNATDLLVATVVESITEISGYHRYKTKPGTCASFGIGSLTKLRTDSKEGMLEGIAQATHFDYTLFAKNFGKGLLEAHSHYVLLFEE